MTRVMKKSDRSLTDCQRACEKLFVRYEKERIRHKKELLKQEKEQIRHKKDFVKQEKEREKDRLERERY